MRELPVNAPIVSKRSVTRLAELQHQLTEQVQLLNVQKSRFLGALLACDATTQRLMMAEYREQLHVVHSILSKLCVILDRYGDPHED